MEVCINPFIYMEIQTNGDVYTCCPNFINNLSVGNIYTDDYKNIWYSDIAKSIRSSVLDGSYKYCNRDKCFSYNPINIDNLSQYTDKDKKALLPKEIRFSYDKECNIACITCRDELHINSKEELEVLDSKIESCFLPLLQNASEVWINGSGEALFSKHSRKLIKEIAQKYPDIKFNFQTNGSVFNEETFKKLNIINILKNIEKISISFPAYDKSIYEKIMVGNNQDKVIENLKWISSLKKTGLFPCVYFHMVISDLNYNQIPQMIEFAKKLDFNIFITQYTYWGTQFGKDFDSLAVWNINHKHYEDFKNILKSIDTTEKVYLQPSFKDIKNS